MKKIIKATKTNTKTQEDIQGVNFNIIKQMKNDYDKMMKTNKEVKYPLIRYKIKEGKVYVNQELINIYLKMKDDRIVHNLELLRKTLEWCKKNNLKIPNTSIYMDK